MKAKWDDKLQFPFFCGNPEYIIGHRIWESEGAYYYQEIKAIALTLLQLIEEDSRKFTILYVTSPHRETMQMQF